MAMVGTRDPTGPGRRCVSQQHSEQIQTNGGYEPTQRFLRKDQETRGQMTQTTEPDIIHEALAIIDKGLTEMQQRKLVSTDEVADLLLDVRTLLSTENEAEEVSPN